MTEDMPPADRDRVAPVGRHVFLAVAFLALVAISVFTVLLPSLEDAPAQGAAGQDAGVPSTAPSP